jgi:glyoxylase-like metal-dependent hydrolase (beta-lactamase superfamily II)
MQQQLLTVGDFEVNCLVLWQDPLLAWVVDPGADADLIRDCLGRHKLQVARYVCTHGHIDHVAALDDLLATHPAPVWMQAADAKWAFSAVNRLPPAYPVAPHLPAALQTVLADGALLAEGGLEARVICTPGHTPGCICLYFESQKLLLSGDTLFAGSVGRTDLPGSDWRQLKRSLAKLLALPDDTRVIAGHGPATTLAVERRTNPHLQGL